MKPSGTRAKSQRAESDNVSASRLRTRGILCCAGGASARNQRGVGLIALPWSVLAFAMFLMLAVQVTVHLFTASVVTAVGHDAARRAALADASSQARAEAEQWLRSRIGPGVDISTLRWQVTADVVALDLVARPPNVLMDASALIGHQQIERRFEVRRERPRFVGSGAFD